jgi:hypothetical protein
MLSADRPLFSSRLLSFWNSDFLIAVDVFSFDEQIDIGMASSYIALGVSESC